MGVESRGDEHEAGVERPHGRLDELDATLRSADAPASYDEIVREAKRAVADTLQAAEVGRLVRCLPDDVRDELGEDVARDAFAELLTSFSVYRVYPPVGDELVAEAVAAASASRPDLADAIATLTPLVTAGDTELSRRFGQTTGPVMAAPGPRSSLRTSAARRRR